MSKKTGVKLTGNNLLPKITQNTLTLRMADRHLFNQAGA